MDVCGCGRPLSNSPTSLSAGENYFMATVTRVRVLLAAQTGDSKASRLVAEGGGHCEQLHAVAHDPAYPGVNYFAIAKWIRKANKRADQAGVTEAHALNFLESNVT